MKYAKHDHQLILPQFIMLPLQLLGNCIQRLVQEKYWCLSRIHFFVTELAIDITCFIIAGDAAFSWNKGSIAASAGVGSLVDCAWKADQATGRMLLVQKLLDIGRDNHSYFLLLSWIIM